MVLNITMFLFLLQNLVTLYYAHALFPAHHHHLQISLETEKTALLSFKKTISLDPNSTLSNWNETTPLCNFKGIKCNQFNHHVKKILLEDAQVVGLLSPFIANLTRLKILRLAGNHLNGIIPSEFSSLVHLQELRLEGNNLHGHIPYSIGSLSKLLLIILSGNNLTGVIPPSLFSNCTLLENVDFSKNSLTGKIPEEIGKCPGLWSLNLYNNQLIGEIPVSLANASSSMFSLDVEYNQLTGELPSKIVAAFSRLNYLHLSYNFMISHNQNTNLGPFFGSLENCTVLKELELAGMGLGGRLPGLVGSLSPDLTSFLLQENQLIGSIPAGLANLSHLITLNLTFNLLNSTIMGGKLGQLPRLEQLLLAHNSFTGPIPAALGQFPHLGLLDLSNNRFSGKIPNSLGNLTQLNYLFLNNNLLLGNIPSTLGQCVNLYVLDLSYNRLTGRIPPELSGLQDIRIFLNLSHNQLEGHLPFDLGRMENVQEIDLSSNNLTGNLFTQVSNCIALKAINFSHNSFQGQIPQSLGDLKSLESLDVSVNNLSGMIPMSLNQIPSLNFLNLSFNDFSGMIPTDGIFSSVTILSFLGNPDLCGLISGMPTCYKSQHHLHSRLFLIWFCIVISLSAFFSTICCVVGCQRLKQVINSSRYETERKAQIELTYNFPRITYKELSEATGMFDEQRLIGSGSYGHVYKGVLQDGTEIAVKVLNLKTGNSTKSFNRECQVLKRIRHRNLMRIITACSLPDFKALVLPYMANGSLDSCLYLQAGTSLGFDSSDLSLIQRVNICSDIAEGMAYLHHHSPVKVIHCDLKPSNVLLNDDMTALVSDFGISRLVMNVGIGNAGAVENMGCSTANMLSGSVGYIAPEYGFGSSTSTKGDVYSFGIIVLEMVTRKRPTDDMFVGGLSLQKWVKNHYNHERIERIVDSSLWKALRDESHEVKKMWEVAITELIELGILCTLESPSARPTMLDAADDLDRLKRYLSGDNTATFATSLGISSSTIGDDY